jgi:hypothetical protein
LLQVRNAGSQNASISFLTTLTNSLFTGSTVDRETENETSETLTVIGDQSYRYLSIQQQRERLPIFKSRTQLLYLIEKYQTLVVVGQTGCGKTTRKSKKFKSIDTFSVEANIKCIHDRTTTVFGGSWMGCRWSKDSVHSGLSCFYNVHDETSYCI